MRLTSGKQRPSAPPGAASAGPRRSAARHEKGYSLLDLRGGALVSRTAAAIAAVERDLHRLRDVLLVLVLRHRAHRFPGPVRGRRSRSTVAGTAPAVRRGVAVTGILFDMVSLCHWALTS